MLDDRIYLRANSSEKRIFREVAKRKIQDGNAVIRVIMRNYIKSYFVEEIQSVTLPAEKALCDEEWAKEKKIPLDANIEVVFKENRIEYNRSDNNSNEPVLVGLDKWDDIFENYPELLEYALGA
ncbi:MULTISPECIES: hypothetical protein [Clostridium]|uniref:Uncharacterized protein n=1 Tax=Clostridium lapidicellarium TaxID=3240931 RepID=A0ABV4DXV6_9CLOT